MLNKVNKEEVIVEDSLIATKSYHDESNKVSKRRTSDKRRLVKIIRSLKLVELNR